MGSEAAARVLWCGNLAENAEREVVHELFLQAGPIQRVDIPKDRDGRQRAYAFITYVHEESVPYAVELFRGTRLYDRTLNLQNRGQQKGAGPVPSGFPQFNPTMVDEFRSMANNFQGNPMFLNDDNRYSNKFKDTKGGPQNNWSRNQFDTERSSNRYEPYNRGGRDRDSYSHRGDRDRYDSKYRDKPRYRDERNDYYQSGRNHRY